MDQFLVRGCISKAWLFPQFNEGTVTFKADSEAMIVKGIIALLLEVYNEATPTEILGEDGSFLSEVGVTQHLSSNRRNGLSNVLKNDTCLRSGISETELIKVQSDGSNLESKLAYVQSQSSNSLSTTLRIS